MAQKDSVIEEFPVDDAIEEFPIDETPTAQPSLGDKAKAFGSSLLSKGKEGANKIASSFPAPPKLDPSIKTKEDKTPSSRFVQKLGEAWNGPEEYTKSDGTKVKSSHQDDFLKIPYVDKPFQKLADTMDKYSHSNGNVAPGWDTGGVYSGLVRMMGDMFSSGVDPRSAVPDSGKLSIADLGPSAGDLKALPAGRGDGFGFETPQTSKQLQLNPSPSIYNKLVKGRFNSQVNSIDNKVLSELSNPNQTRNIQFGPPESVNADRPVGVSLNPSLVESLQTTQNAGEGVSAAPKTPLTLPKLTRVNTEPTSFRINFEPSFEDKVKSLFPKKEPVIAPEVKAEVVPETKIEEPKIEEPKVNPADSVPDNQKTKIVRGKKAPIDLIFSDPESKSIFGAGQKWLNKNLTKEELSRQFITTRDKIAATYNIPKEQAGNILVSYNDKVKIGMFADTPEKGENLNWTAPSFAEHLKENNIVPPEAPIKVESSGEVDHSSNSNPISSFFKNLIKDNSGSSSGLPESWLDKLKGDNPKLDEKIEKFNSDNPVVGDARSQSELAGLIREYQVVKSELGQLRPDSKYGAEYEGRYHGLREQIARFFKDESGELDTKKLWKNLKKIGDNSGERIYNEVIENLASGGRLSFAEIFNKYSGKVNKTQFNKIIKAIEEDSEGTRRAVDYKRRILTEQQRLASPAIKQFHDMLSEVKVNRDEQDIINTRGRARQASAFEANLGKGREGALRGLGAMKGEFGKAVNPPLELPEDTVNDLYNHISQNPNLASFEKVRAITALTNVLDGNRTPGRADLALLDKIYGSGTSERIIEMHGGLGLVAGSLPKLSKVGNTAKALQTTGDVSLTFRQGVGLIHRKEFYKAYIDMWKNVSEEEYHKIQDARTQDPEFLFSKESGLDITDHTPGNFEEQFLDNFLNDVHDKGGLVGRVATTPYTVTERLNTGFINKLRFDTFKSLIAEAKKAGLETEIFEPITDKQENVTGQTRMPSPLAKEIGAYVNNATGRGSLGALNKYSEGLNALLFSPKFMASRLSIINPMYYTKASPFVRKQALKTLFAYAGFITVAGSLGAVLGGSVRGNPLVEIYRYINGDKNEFPVTDPDFNKIKVGNTRIDPGAGSLQYVVAAARLQQDLAKLGQKTSFGQKSGLGRLAGFGERSPSFLENRLAPIPRFIDSVMSNRNSQDITKPMSVKQEVARTFSNMLVNDAIDVLKDDPTNAWMIPLAAHGIGIQTYNSDQNTSRFKSSGGGKSRFRKK